MRENILSQNESPKNLGHDQAQTKDISLETPFPEAIDPIMRLKVQVALLSEIRSRMQFLNREISYLMRLPK
jgi:hypothetical protein